MARLSVREMIDRLIATPSVSAVDPALDMGNAAMIDTLATWLEDEGFAVELLPVAESKKKANLIATRGRGPGGLVLSGHTDTVPYHQSGLDHSGLDHSGWDHSGWDHSGWTSDPFTATERDGELYGLGTTDMKSFLALAIEASRAFDDADLSEPLILLATADEESGMDGARALVDAGRPKARRAIIGEPTGLRPIRLHKGCGMERLELVGRTGHSSDPAHGASALEGMHAAIGALLAARDSLSHLRREELTPPHSTINLGRIEGGDNPNRICGRCVLTYDLRLVPGLDPEEVRAAIRRGVA